MEGFLLGEAYAAAGTETLMGTGLTPAGGIPRFITDIACRCTPIHRAAFFTTEHFYNQATDSMHLRLVSILILTPEKHT